MCSIALEEELQGLALTISCMARNPDFHLLCTLVPKKAYMNATTSTKFVQQLCERLNWAYKTAQHVIEKENKIHKQNYDYKIRCTQLGVGDLILLKDSLEGQV